MKTVCLFILMLAVLYNPKVQAQEAITGIADTIQMQDAEFILDNDIVLKKKNPLKDVEDNLESYLLLTGLFRQYQLHNISLSKGLLQKLQNNKTLLAFPSLHCSFNTLERSTDVKARQLNTYFVYQRNYTILS